MAREADCHCQYARRLKSRLTYQRASPFPPELVTDVRQEEGTKNAASLEEAVRRRQQIRAIRASVELHVGDEGRLPQRGTNDGRSVSICE
jgi:hypothetical protein